MAKTSGRGSLLGALTGTRRALKPADLNFFTSSRSASYPLFFIRLICFRLKVRVNLLRLGFGSAKSLRDNSSIPIVTERIKEGFLWMRIVRTQFFINKILNYQVLRRLRLLIIHKYVPC